MAKLRQRLHQQYILRKHILKKKILLASIDPAHSLQDSLSGFEGLDNLITLEINAEKSLEKFKDKHEKTLRTIADRGTFLDNEDISNFLSLSMPGLDEVMGMIDVIEFLKSSSYDMVVLDTAPTGHTLRFLGLPDVIRKWLKALDSMLAKHRYMKMLYARKYKKDEVDNFLEGMSKDVKGLSRLLQDSAKCEFVPVMILEKLVIQETIRLLASLEKHGIPVKNIIINQVYEYSACPLCKSKRLLQEKLLEEAGCVLDKYNLIKIPLYCKEIQGIGALNEYGENLKLIWRNAGDTGKGYGFHVPGYELNSQPATRNLQLCEVKDPCITSNRQQSSGIEYQVSGNKHRTLSSSLIDNAQILLVGGKGGVGKTTLSCALALQSRCVDFSRKILLISTDPAHSLSDCLDINIGEEGKVLYENLHVMEINAEKEFEYLKNLYSAEIKDMFNSILEGSMIDVKFDQDVMERLLDFSPPGLDEVMALTKIIDYIEEERYDVFILDTAPTGHLIRFLELPELIEGWLRTFLIYS